MENFSKNFLTQQFNDYFVKNNQFETIELPVIQPASLFLEFASNQFIRNMIRFRDNGGRSLCLRPDFTIPVSQYFIQSNIPQARYFYHGNTFQQVTRSHDEGTDLVEKYAYGIEMYTHEKDIANQEADLIKAALNALCYLGFQQNDLTIHIVDISFLQHMIECLMVSQATKRHLNYVIKKHGSYAAIPQDTKEKLNDCNDQETAAYAQKLLHSLKNDTVITGSRTIDDIRQRLTEKALFAVTPIAKDIWRFMDEIAALDSGIIDCIETLVEIQKRYVDIVNLDNFMTSINQYIKAFKMHNLLVDNICFKAESLSTFQYYDMFAFEIYYRNNPHCLSRGGRYDSLLFYMQSKKYVSACGFSLFSDAILADLPIVLSEKQGKG